MKHVYSGMLLFLLLLISPNAAISADIIDHIVEPGDTWAALAWRFQTSVPALMATQNAINPARQPVVGSTIRFETAFGERLGWFQRLTAGGLLETAVNTNLNPYLLATDNFLPLPNKPLIQQPLGIANTQTNPREYPFGFASLEFSSTPAHPGEVFGIRARGAVTNASATIFEPFFGEIPFTIHSERRGLIGMLGTGNFLPEDVYELRIVAADNSVWSQPIFYQERELTFQDLNLTGAAGNISQLAIDQEREQLFELWETETPFLFWTSNFQEPLDEYIKITAPYGVRRSVNGGPYDTFHEGIDYAAVGGTPVMAAADGLVIIAQDMYVRGGTVIIDHGLGVYTGYYHLSEVNAELNQPISKGDILGEVGTTGLSTGNHLHWDLLVNGRWVDAQAWTDQNLACWFSEGLGIPCD